MQHLTEQLGEYACFLLPAFLVLWLLPWVMFAVFLDRPKRQVTIAQLMGVTALWSVELGSGYWLGSRLIASGMFCAGIMIFLPTLAVLSRIRWRRRKLQALVAPSAKSATG